MIPWNHSRDGVRVVRDALDGGAGGWRFGTDRDRKLGEWNGMERLEVGHVTRMGMYGVVLGIRLGAWNLHVLFKTTSAFQAARLAVKEEVTRRAWLLDTRLGMRRLVSAVRWKKLRCHRSNRQSANHGGYWAMDCWYGKIKLCYEEIRMGNEDVG